ncbi:hypothetical protein DBW_1857 [Desulfuromonas sp. DDH964]|uniref:Rha family transcriptional regulator n=1 Tax=Desulfuromonas sp. DDH964 TaxID=1823759 RepID=UPI00078D44DE|nr:Rha family transcriptional regulator [Desulfuromonas sp. DDH964]AMV72211.1 hypothetical protein DBW_1857 [Desulfuromonas sp. DDH964]
MVDQLVTITEEKVVTTSLVIAEAFEKRHDLVMRSIRGLECSNEFAARNFAGGSYLDANNQARPMFTITRDGFAFLAMGFTGKRAAEFKEKFIGAFNTMEQALIEGQGERRSVDINHRRGITNPHGLDVRYTLDLTKIILRPTRESLATLERLTGVDLSGIVSRPAGVPGAVASWIDQVCSRTDEGAITARAAYQSFLGWWALNQDDDPPSQKRFGDAIAQAGFQKDRSGPGGSFRYRGLELRDAGAERPAETGN